MENHPQEKPPIPVETLLADARRMRRLLAKLEDRSDSHYNFWLRWVGISGEVQSVLDDTEYLKKGMFGR